MPTSSQQGPFIALYSTMLWGISWPLCPMVLGRLIPRSTKDFTDGPLNVLLLDQALQAAKVSGPYLSYQPLGPGK